MDTSNFLDLVERARDGDAAAIERLLRDFEPEVRLMVRIRLPRTLRDQFDSMDFVQAVWTSLFTGPSRPDLDFADAGHFRGYLAGVVRNKVWEEYRRRTRSRKYDVRREQRLHVRRHGEGEIDATRELTAPDPSPSQALQADERMAQLLAGRTPSESEILRLRREGLTLEEIAERVGLSERTIRRLIESLRARMEARQWR
jgi:RNA polymerase sigma-70 factor (ECF subfamily)